jgi:hypothetical protein
MSGAYCDPMLLCLLLVSMVVIAVIPRRKVEERK